MSIMGPKKGFRVYNRNKKKKTFEKKILIKYYIAKTCESLFKHQ